MNDYEGKNKRSILLIKVKSVRFEVCLQWHRGFVAARIAIIGCVLSMRSC